MEKPYKGRATIIESFNGLTIEIPANRNWFVIIFMTGWLGCWFIGELLAVGVVLGIIGDGMEGTNLFVLFWSIAWTAGGFVAIRAWLYMIGGSELIKFENRHLILDKKFALFYKGKSYDLSEVKKFSINSNSSNFWGSNQNQMWNLGSSGTLKFDYGLKTIKLAEGIDEAEGRYLIDKLKEKQILTEKNYT